MEDHRDELVVILAGYTKEMEMFLTANSGLASRFPNKIEFPDYTADELLDITAVLAKGKATALPRAAPSRCWATISAVRRWTAAPPAMAVWRATRWKRPFSIRAAASSPSPPQSLISSSPAIWNLRNKRPCADMI